MSIQTALVQHIRPLLDSLTPDTEKYTGMIRRASDDKFGDYQANFPMPLGKSLGRNPRELASELAAAWTATDLCPAPDVAGPGFLNFKISNQWLEQYLAASLTDSRLQVPTAENPKTIVIDYSAPNVAKPMHVGHIRSTSIGDALYKILKFLGHNTISDNHIGDWGTQFGMMIWGYRHILNQQAFDEAPVKELTRIYREVRKMVDDGLYTDDTNTVTVSRAVHEEVSKLHHGDEENLKLWKKFMEVSYTEIDEVYRRLNVKFDMTLGESFYQPILQNTVDQLLEKGIAEVSDGATVVFNEGQPAPFIVKKSDGAFIYGTTDMATLLYRQEHFHPDTVLYVVDFRQSDHFKGLFATFERLTGLNLELKHISFGTVLGEDGKPFKTRSGDTVGLSSLLDDAESAARKVVQASEVCQAMTDQQREDVVHKVGIGALKYADLSQSRDSDYVFSLEKMTALTGNTATYMQYAYARVSSIFQKGNIDIEQFRSSAPVIKLTQPQERALAIELTRFGEVLQSVGSDYRPNLLTTYLFELAARYSTFFESCPVLRAESEDVKATRLVLCDLTARTIRKGLELLGIETVDRM